MQLATRKKLNEEGIGLVEVIFALGISIVIITSLVSLALFTLRSSLNSKLLLQGSKLANQELEYVRVLRDISVESSSVGWAGFIDYIRDCSPPNGYCYVANLGGLNPISSSVRTVSIGSTTVTIYFLASETDGDVIGGSDYPDVVRISVSASWNIGGQTKSVHNYTDLSNWR